MKFKLKRFLPALPFLALTAAVAAACVSATVTEPSICVTKSLSYSIPSVPNIPTQYLTTDTCDQYIVSLPPQSTTTSFDVSDSLSKLNKVADGLEISTNTFTLDNSQGQFSWVTTVDVEISTPTLPMSQLARYSAPGSGAPVTIEPQVVMSNSDLLKYLSSGLITMTITLQAENVSACQAVKVESSGTSSSNLNLCVSVSGKFNKSL